jgi:uncharacterized membrane protein
MRRRLAPLFSTLWRGAIVLLTVEIAIVSLLRYIAESEAAPEPILANAHADPFLIVHVLTGVLALLVGPLQFVKGVRARVPGVHRASGYIYAAACTLAAPAGFMLALGTTAGPVAGAGFAIPAVLLPVFTWLGVRAAVEGRLGEHREWMLRSYAIIATAITLRIMLPASAWLGFDFLPAYQVIAWLSWSTNLVLVEHHIRRTRARPAAYGTLVAT